LHAGAPACLGDAGLFVRSALKEGINNGCLRILDVRLVVEGQPRSIHPFLVGDAAFGLEQHMQKNFGPQPPAPGSAQAMYNKRVTDCRRRVEITFGELKGRCVVCKRNVFWYDVDFLSEGIIVCCALHNFLTDRGVEYDATWAVEHKDDIHGEQMPVQVAPQLDTGCQLRDMLVAHFSGQ
jgi:DDE superfamily endonuclease